MLPPFDVPAVPPLDVPVVPPLDVPAVPPFDVPVVPPLDVPVAPPLDAPVVPPLEVALVEPPVFGRSAIEPALLQPRNEIATIRIYFFMCPSYLQAIVGRQSIED
jgi:hypothetical protein